MVEIRREEKLQIPGLTSFEVIEKVYDLLIKTHGNSVIEFEEEVRAEIDSFGSDFHRYQRSYMSYNSVTLLDIEAKVWAIGIGRADRNFPAEDIVGDLIALEVPRYFQEEEGKLREDLAETIRTRDCFYNSLLIATDEGLFPGISGNRFNAKGKAAGIPVAPADYLARYPEVYSDGINLSTLSPVVTESAYYNPKIIDGLTRRTVEILSSGVMTPEEYDEYALKQYKKQRKSEI